MKNVQTLSAMGRKAREGFCRCGSGASASSGASTSSFSGSRDEIVANDRCRVNKLVRLLGEEVKTDDKVLFDNCTVSRSRRNAFANIFCGLPSKGLRRLFAVYGIDEVQTKAPYLSLDLDEEARRERQINRQLRESRAERQHNQRAHHQHRAHSATEPSRRRQLPAFVVADSSRVA